MAHSHSITEYPYQLAAIVGTALIGGFVAGALVTHRTGSENREALKERLRNLANVANTTKDSAATRASEIKDVIEDTVPKVDSDEGRLQETPDKDLTEK